MGELVPTKVSSSVHPSRPSRASVPVRVSGRMIAEGARVLWESGVLEGRLGSDGLLVAEIFRAMTMVRHER